MDPSFKGKPQPVAEAVDFRQINLHANNLQEQLNRHGGIFCRGLQFELNARKQNPDWRISANIHYESARFEINYINISKLSE
jgi:hypothetical protein